MNKELIKKIKIELIYILSIFILFLIVFKVFFNKESFIIIFRFIIAFFWLFVLPGFFIMYYWYRELDFIERFIIGTALGFAIIGIIGYNLGLFNIRMKIQIIFLPLLSFLFAFFLIKKQNSNTH